MEYIDIIVKQIIGNFDFSFMVTINIFTYIMVKFITLVRAPKKVNTWQKRAVLVVGTILFGAAYKLVGYENNIILINSAIAAPVIWDWVLRPILTKFGLNYKKIDNYIN